MRDQLVNCGFKERAVCRKITRKRQGSAQRFS